MDGENDHKMRLKKDFHIEDALRHHRPWYIYTAATRLKQPFLLEELQNAIHEKTGVRPQMRRLLREIYDFYEKYEIAIINQVVPGEDIFIANQDIDLEKDSYQSIIRSPQETRGRPRKKYTQSRDDARKYIRNYQRLNRRPEKFLASVFQSADQVSVEEISIKLRELTESVSFRPSTIQKLLDRYISKGRGPPYLQEIQSGLYREVTELHAGYHQWQTERAEPGLL